MVLTRDVTYASTENGVSVQCRVVGDRHSLNWEVLGSESLAVSRMGTQE